MSSLIANKIKINLCLISIKLSNNNLFIRYSYYTIIRYSSHISARVNTNNYSVDLYNGNHQSTTVFLIRKSSSHKSDWILTASRLLGRALLQYYSNSLTNVPKVESSCSRIIEYSIANTLSFVYCVHIVTVSFHAYCLCSCWYSFCLSFFDLKGWHTVFISS